MSLNINLQVELEKIYPKTFRMSYRLPWSDFLEGYQNVFTEETQALSSLPLFLRRQQVPPYLAEMAALEWSLYAVELEPNDEKLTAVKLKKGALKLAPSLKVHKCQFDLTDVGIDGVPVAAPTLIFVIKNLHTKKASILKADVYMAAIVDELTESGFDREELLKALRTKYSFLEKEKGPFVWNKTLRYLVDMNILL